MRIGLILFSFWGSFLHHIHAVIGPFLSPLLGIVSASYSRRNQAVSVCVMVVVSASYPHRNRMVSVPVLGIASASYSRGNRAISVPVIDDR